MDQSNSHGAFAHRGRATLNRAVPDVTCGEHAGNTCFQIERVPLERPGGRRFAAIEQIRPGDQVSTFIANDADVGGPLGNAERHRCRQTASAS